ncbi:YEATS domain-containing protein 2 [Bulinus truncatus]|nr:YEATS domain-containing protein 2 [Bulinus truncatus]
MSGQKRNLEEVDPDYADICAEQNKRQRALEEDAKQTVCHRIQNIMKNEFLKEINNKESELQQVDKRLSEARLMMDRLRACVVASYYGQINNATSVQTPNVNAPPPSIHTAVKKFIGKAPSHQISITDNGHPNHIQENHQEILSNLITQEAKLFRGSDSSKSTRPSSVPANSAPDSSIANSMTYDDRRSRFKIKKKIIVGNVSKYITVGSQRKSNDILSHKWMVYVRGPRVTPDMSKDGREFPVRVQLHFVDPRNKKVIEVELEKDFFEASDSTSSNSLLPTQVHPKFSAAASLMKLAADSDVILKVDKTQNDGNEMDGSPDSNSSHPVPREPVLTIGSDENDVHKPDEQIQQEEYHMTIAHEDPEDNVIDVCADGHDDNIDNKPLVTENHILASPFSPFPNDNTDDKKLMDIKEPLHINQQMSQNIKTEGNVLWQPPQETNITMGTPLGNPTVIHHKQVFTVFSSPVSLAKPSVTVTSSQPIVSQFNQNISQNNKPVILVPSIVSTNNSQIVNSPSLLAIQQKDINPLSMQKVIFMNSNSPVAARLPAQSSTIRHVVPKPISLLNNPLKPVSLLTAPPKPVSLKAVSKPISLLTASPKPVSLTAVSKPVSILTAAPRPVSLLTAAPKQFSLLTGHVVKPFTAPVQQVSSSSTHMSTSLLNQKPNISNSTGQTYVLNKAANQVLLVNSALPQTVHQTNPLTDLSCKVIYPSNSSYQVAVNVAVRPTKQFSLLKNLDVLPSTPCISSESVIQDLSSAVNNQHKNLATMTSLDPSLNFPKLSALGKTKHAKNCLKTPDIKIEKKVPTEEERKKGQYEVLKAWKENPELYERSSVKAKRIVLAARDKIEGEAEDIPELIIADYSSMSSLLKDAVKLHPLIQENVNKLTHPYCAHSLEQWTSWPIGKQRANELASIEGGGMGVEGMGVEGMGIRDMSIANHNQKGILAKRNQTDTPYFLGNYWWHGACFVLKYLKKCLNNKTEYKGIGNFGLQENSSTGFGFMHLVLVQNQDLEIVNIEINQPKLTIKTEIEDTAKINCKSGIQCISPSEGAEFIYDELRKRCLKFEPTELEPGIYTLTVMDMLYKVMLEFGSDIIRESASILSQTQSGIRQSEAVITRHIVHSALTHLPEAGFCCDKFLGKEEEDDGSVR